MSHTPPARLRVLALLALLAGLGPSPGAAQETESPLSPAGRLRLEVAPAFVSWDRRFGHRTEDGRVVEESEPLGLDLDGRDASAFFPGVPDLEGSLRDLIDDPDYDGVLGASRALVSADRVTVPFRLDVGVIDWLTVGVTVPLVKNRTEVDFDFDPSGANLGANPAVSTPATVVGYVDALGDAAAAADAHAADVCDDAPGSAECGSASTLVADLRAFRSGLTGAYGASFLFPTASSDVGQALLDRSGDLDARLVDAGLAGIGPTLPLGSAIPDREGFGTFVEGTFVTPPLGDRVGIWELGDVEVHAAVRLLEGARRDSAGAPARLRWEVGAAGLVRLGTGLVDDPNVILDRGAGDGQTDIEGRLFANLTRGRYGLWADGRYGVQLSRTLQRRVGPPDLPFLSAAGLSTVEWTPGNYLQLDVAPRYQLTDELAFAGGYRLWSKGEDSYGRISAAPAPPSQAFIPAGPLFTDVSLLGLETAETRHELGLGMVYNTLEAWSEGRAPVPLEARVIMRWAVAGSGGMTAETFQTRIALRLYRRLWGE